jgi:anti-sigma regulatory factor (Ser/Thr protein kinase)
MSGGTGAVSAGRVTALPASPEHRSGAGAAYQWPLRTHLELATLPTAVACLRKHAKMVALEWHLSADLCDTAELVVSELVTNSIRASHGLTLPVVRLWLVSDGRKLLVQVWDGCTTMPTRTHAGPDADTGRGLMIVDALAEQWDCYAVDGGKVVRALIGADSC